MDMAPSFAVTRAERNLERVISNLKRMWVGFQMKKRTLYLEEPMLTFLRELQMARVAFLQCDEPIPARLI